MLSIIGGTYYERCQEPNSHELYGSGLRAAAALSKKGFDIRFNSCIGKADMYLANLLCNTFGITPSFEPIEETITFYYNHPLSRPLAYPDTSNQSKILLPEIVSENILYYGQIEATAKVNGSYVVYDPQNGIRFKDTGSKAKHLALVLNRREALSISGLTEDMHLNEIGKALLDIESAEVVVIKNGSRGALVIDRLGVNEIPVFETSSVWPIGSGDIFSAVFAWKWIIEKKSAAESALFASRYTALYCESIVLPLPQEPKMFEALPQYEQTRKIYLAGPFFTMAERWFLEELREILLDFGNQVLRLWLFLSK
jgi:sugar/nucleoside kinase (ribokinase family)